MKTKNLIKYLLVLFMTDVKAQYNLIPNSGFEIGPNAPQCTGYTDIGDPATHRPIETDISGWAVAHQDAFDSKPQWEDPGLCTVSGNVYYGISRYVWLRCDLVNNEHDGVRIQLTETLQPNTFYKFRIFLSIAPHGQNNSNDGTTFNGLKLRLSKWGVHWYSGGWGHAYVEFSSSLGLTQIANSPWYVQEFTWYSGNMFLFPYSHIGNLVLHTKDLNEPSYLYIDDVEFYKKCPSEMLLENQEYHYNSNVNYSTTNNIKAGYDVGATTTNGNVTVKEGAVITYIAPNYIELNPGFEVENGATFTADILSCNNFNFINDEIEPDTIVLNVTELSCPIDTLRYVGLEGDTSYTSFHWDFGNGDTSNSKVVSVYYNTPGSYQITLIIRDSLDNTDTLTQNIVVPYCNQRLASQYISNSKSDYSIEPNPSNGIIKFNNFSASSKGIIIFDTDGRKVYESNINEKSFIIDLSLHPKGIYFAKVISGDEITVSKIIVQ